MTYSLVIKHLEKETLLNKKRREVGTGMESFKIDQSGTLAVAGTEVYFEFIAAKDARTDKAFLLLHGFVSSTYSFRYLVPYLAKIYPVLVVDLPGFGKSGKTSDFEYSFDNYSALMFHLLDLFKIKKAILIGHSMGGQVALYMAKSSPKRIDKIVLLSSSGYLKRVKRQFYYASFFPFSNLILKWWFEKRDYQKALSHVYFNKDIDKKSLTEYCKPFKESEFFHAMIRLMRDREGDLTSEQLRQIKIKTLILWGKEDEIIPVRIGKCLHRDLPNSVFKQFEKTGHLLPEEKAQEVAKEITSFVKSK